MFLRIILVFTTFVISSMTSRGAIAQESEPGRTLQLLQDTSANGVRALVYAQLQMTFGSQSREATIVFGKALDELRVDTALTTEQRMRETFRVYQAGVNSLLTELWGGVKHNLKPIADDAPIKEVTGRGCTRLLMRIEEIEMVLKRDSTDIPEVFP